MLQWLLTRDWPAGNVRELSNIVETLALMCDGDTIGLEDLPPSESISGATGPCSTDRPADFKSAVEAFQERILLESITRANGVKARAARELALAPSQMNYLVHKDRL